MEIEIREVEDVKTTTEIAGDVPPWDEEKTQCL